MDRDMPSDKRDERALLPTFDAARLWRDLGGDRVLSERMSAAGFRDFWELKTVQARRRRPDLYVGRLLELLHVHRQQGRTIRLEDYIVWNSEAQYPPPSTLPQPVPVSQRQE